MSIIDEVKAIPIRDAFAAFFLGVELKADGRNLTALCPFHSEKTPSFKLDTAKNR
ncbi:MAG TPA: CHC2 zinc finger domain-containing protein [Candidatus Binatia bacterium]